MKLEPHLGETSPSYSVKWELGLSLNGCTTGPASAVVTHEWSALSDHERELAFPLERLFCKFRESAENGALRGSSTSVAEYAEQVSSSISEILQKSENLEQESMLRLQQDKAIWDALNIVLIESQRTGSLTQSLTRWMYDYSSLFSFSTASSFQLEADKFAEMEVPEAEVSYWNLVHKLVALGAVKETIDLLGAHSVWTTSYKHQQQDSDLAAQYGLVEAIIFALRQMPILSSTAQPGGTTGRPISSGADLAGERAAWKHAVKQNLLVSLASSWQPAGFKSTRTRDGLRKLVDILCGDLDTIRQVTDTCLELFVAFVCHVLPGQPVKNQLVHAVENSSDAKHPTNTTIQLETMWLIIEALAHGEQEAVMEVCSQRTSLWLPAHIPDLLAPAFGPSLVEPKLPHLGCSLAEFYMVEYVNALAAVPAQQLTALKLLAWCPRHGEGLTRRIIQQISGRLDATEVRRLEAHCRRMGLDDVLELIWKMQGRRYMQEGQLAEALKWLTNLEKLDDADECAALMVRQLTDSLLLRGPSSEDVAMLREVEGILEVAQARHTHLGNFSLRFLQDYLRYVSAFEDNSRQAAVKAAACLKDLLGNGCFQVEGRNQTLAPSKAVALLFHALPILEQNASAISDSHARQLLALLQSLLWRPASAHSEKSAVDGLKVEAVTLALGRLQQRSFLSQSST